MRRLIVSLLLVLPISAARGQADGTALLARALDAYGGTAPFQETLDLTLQMPDGREEGRRQRYGVTADGGCYLVLSAGGHAGLTLVAEGERAVVEWSHIPAHYAETAYDGSLAAVLDRLGAAESNIATPPAVVAAQGGDLDAFVEALRFGVLGALHVTGATADSVDLAADNGTLTVGVDPASGRLATVQIALGQGAEQVRARGAFTFTSGASSDAPAWPELSGRTAVATLEELEASTYPLGEPAPEASFRTADGETLRLADLAGEVVVLDFWATWCVPCWSALEQTEILAGWAASAGRPVRVYAVDTLERIDGWEAQRDQAASFLTSRDLHVPLLVDPGGEAFAALHNPGLPSLVVIGPDGRLAGYHSGVAEEMAQTVRGEVEALLGERP
ncbi:MAG: TlpA disulfide reductase family protein [Thermoanaerobaculia bacterium]